MPILCHLFKFLIEICIKDVLKANGIDYFSDLSKVETTLEVYKTLLKDAIEAKQVRWEALSNVNELLEACHNSGDFHIALGR